MMFGEIVGAVRVAFAPINLKLALADAVADPIETHVDGFGAFLLDSVSGNAAGGTIVGGHGCCRLGMPHFLESDAQWAGFLSIVE